MGKPLALLAAYFQDFNSSLGNIGRIDPASGDGCDLLSFDFELRNSIGALT